MAFSSFRSPKMRSALCSACFLLSSSCANRQANIPPAPGQIDYRVIEDGEIWFKHSFIQLRFDSEMYCRVFMSRGGRLMSINDIPPVPEKAKPTHFIEVNGEEIKDFSVDYKNVGISDIKSQFGIGKRLNLVGNAQTRGGVQIVKDLTVDFYQEFPDTAILWAVYRNVDKDRSIRITKSANIFFRMDAARAKAGTLSHAFWSFQGASQKAGQNVIRMLEESFNQTHHFDPVASASEGRVPLLDLWTAEMGMAIADISRQPQASSLRLQVAADRRVEMSIQSSSNQDLGANESFTTPQIFLMVHTEDFTVAMGRYTELSHRRDGN